MSGQRAKASANFEHFVGGGYASRGHNASQVVLIYQKVLAQTFIWPQPILA
jgi:hypothetical protein